MKNFTFTIYNNTSELPLNWDEVAVSNSFLQTSYLKVLEDAAPINMQCFYIGVFEESQLIGVMLAQYINVSKLESFGDRDRCLKTAFRNFIFKNFASHVLFLGNNMITGQNGFVFSKHMDFDSIGDIMKKCSKELTQYFRNKKIQIHLITFKDFYQKCAQPLKLNSFKNFYEFNTQPNMIFTLKSNWNNEADYVNELLKKYRDQFKRARKKLDGVEVKELSLEEVILHENRIYELYYYVAKNAPFNTFFLKGNHFTVFKKQCGNRFKIFGYFLEGKLVGFHTILINGKVLETYFLGYDSNVQKDKMLYLNMLYNMTMYGIENHFEQIIFGRTALEIKSSIGASPVMMSGFIYHTNSFINKLMPYIFNKLEPNTNWQERHPFK